MIDSLCQSARVILQIIPGRTCYTSFSSVSIFDFEQVDVCWECYAVFSRAFDFYHEESL